MWDLDEKREFVVIAGLTAVVGRFVEILRRVFLGGLAAVGLL